MSTPWQELPKVGRSLIPYLDQDYADTYRNLWEAVIDFGVMVPNQADTYIETVEALLALGLDESQLERAMKDLSFEIVPGRFGYTFSGWLEATVSVLRAVCYPK